MAVYFASLFGDKQAIVDCFLGTGGVHDVGAGFRKLYALTITASVRIVGKTSAVSCRPLSASYQYSFPVFSVSVIRCEPGATFVKFQ